MQIGLQANDCQSHALQYSGLRHIWKDVLVILFGNRSFDGIIECTVYNVSRPPKGSPRGSTIFLL